MVLTSASYLWLHPAEFRPRTDVGCNPLCHHLFITSSLSPAAQERGPETPPTSDGDLSLGVEQLGSTDAFFDMMGEEEQNNNPRKIKHVDENTKYKNYNFKNPLKSKTTLSFISPLPPPFLSFLSFLSSFFSCTSFPLLSFVSSTSFCLFLFSCCFPFLSLAVCSTQPFVEINLDELALCDHLLTSPEAPSSVLPFSPFSFSSSSFSSP